MANKHYLDWASDGDRSILGNDLQNAHSLPVGLELELERTDCADRSGWDGICHALSSRHFVDYHQYGFHAYSAKRWSK